MITDMITRIISLPEPYQTLAKMRTEKRHHLWRGDPETLENAFSWGSSKEGHDFWESLAENPNSHPKIPWDASQEMELWLKDKLISEKNKNLPI